MIEKLKWLYKDHSRYWWKIEAWKSLEDPPDFELPDWIWEYEIFRDEVSVFRSSLKGQYEMVPYPEEFFLEYLYYVGAVSAGVAKYAKEEGF